jgi:hypothetical protein
VLSLEEHSIVEVFVPYVFEFILNLHVVPVILTPVIPKNVSSHKVILLVAQLGSENLKSLDISISTSVF